MASNIREILYAAYHGDKAARTTATDQLTALMESSNSILYLLELVEAGVDASLPLDQSLSALLYAKNSLLHTISAEVLESNQEALAEVEKKIFAGMFVVPETHRRILCTCAAVLISSCEWNYLDDLLPLVVQAAQGEPVGGVQSPAEYVKALLQLLHTYVKRFITPLLESAILQFKVLETLVNVMEKFVSLYPQDYFIIRLVFKVMECLIEAALHMNSAAERKKLNNKPDIFDSWWRVMLQFVQFHLPPSSPDSSSSTSARDHHLPRLEATGEINPQFVACIKRVAKITFSVLNDATRRKKPVLCAAHFIGRSLLPSKPTPAHLRKKKGNKGDGVSTHSDPEAVSCSYSYAFMMVWQNWVRFCVACHSPAGAEESAMDMEYANSRELFRKSELFAIRYLKLCTLEESLYRQCILPQAMVWVEQLFLPYLWYNEEDHDVFFSQEDNLSTFTQYMLEESVGFGGEFSTRQAASNAILSLIGGKKSFHAGVSLLLPLVQALGEELQLATTSAHLPKLFGTLHLLSILRKHLRNHDVIWQQQMHVVLAQSVAPWIAQRSSLMVNSGTEGKSTSVSEEQRAISVAIRSKAITVCQRYAKVPMPSEEVFSSFVHMMCQSLADSDPRIRLAAIDAICTLLEMKRARNYLRPYLSCAIEQCLEFLHKVSTSFIPTVILYVVTHFAPEIASMLDSLCGAVVQEFLATSFQLQCMEDDVEGKDGDGADVVNLDNSNGLQGYDAAVLSADMMLRTIDTIVTACDSTEEVKGVMMGKMLPDLIRLFRSVLDNNPHLSLDVLELVLTILSHTVSNCSPHIPPALWELLPFVFQTLESGMGVDVFDTIEGLLDNFISGSPTAFFGNAPLMEWTLQSGEMILQGPAASEECKRAVPLLWEAMLHQAKGPVTAPKIAEVDCRGVEVPSAASLGTAPSTSFVPGLLDPHLPRMLQILLQSLLQSPPPKTTGDVSLRIWTLAAVMDCFYYNSELTLRVLLESQAAQLFFQGFFHFLRGCIPNFFVSEDLNKKENGAKQKTKKNSGKKMISGFDEVEEVVSGLSILTRKVIILGLSSLLAYLHQVALSNMDPSNVLHEFVTVFYSQFLTPANALIEYCITTNFDLYTKRCETARQNLARIASGEEEDVEDVDLDDDAVLGIDGGEEDEEEDSLSEHPYGSDGDNASDIDALSLEREEIDGLGFPYDEGDDYESPIDELNEVQFFLQSWLEKLPLPPPYDSLVMGESVPALVGARGIAKRHEEYMQFASTASTYRQLCLELEVAAKKDFTERTENVTSPAHNGN